MNNSNLTAADVERSIKERAKQLERNMSKQLMRAAMKKRVDLVAANLQI